MDIVNYTGVEGVILAAGFSRRAEAYKMTMDLCGKTVIERCIENMYNYCSRIIVVGGYRFDQLVPLANKYQKVKLIYNEDFKEGMFSSVKRGLIELKESRVFITPGDYPAISDVVFKKLLESDKEIAVPVYQGKNGHPILLKSYLIDNILAGSGFLSLRDFVSSRKYAKVEVNDQGILLDLDTPEDYKILYEYVILKDVVKTKI